MTSREDSALGAPKHTVNVSAKDKELKLELYGERYARHARDFQTALFSNTGGTNCCAEIIKQIQELQQSSDREEKLKKYEGIETEDDIKKLTDALKSVEKHMQGDGFFRNFLDGIRTPIIFKEGRKRSGKPNSQTTLNALIPKHITGATRKAVLQIIKDTKFSKELKERGKQLTEQSEKCEEAARKYAETSVGLYKSLAYEALMKSGEIDSVAKDVLKSSVLKTSVVTNLKNDIELTLKRQFGISKSKGDRATIGERNESGAKYVNNINEAIANSLKSPHNLNATIKMLYEDLNEGKLSSIPELGKEIVDDYEDAVKEVLGQWKELLEPLYQMQQDFRNKPEGDQKGDLLPEYNGNFPNFRKYTGKYHDFREG
jgi:hypothetical protein